MFQNLFRGLQCEAGFSAAACASERHQPDVLPQQELLRGRKYFLASDQWSALNGQIMTPLQGRCHNQLSWMILAKAVREPKPPRCRFALPKSGDIAALRQLDYQRILASLRRIVPVEQGPKPHRFASHGRVQLGVVVWSSAKNLHSNYGFFELVFSTLQLPFDQEPEEPRHALVT